MISIRLTLALLATAFAPGCAGVYVEKPIGDKPHPLVASDWNGVWILDTLVAHAAVTDAAAGTLRLHRMESEPDSTRVKLVAATAWFTESGDRRFVTFRDDEDKANEGRYVWALVRASKDQLLVWWPDVDRLREFVREGKLAGRLDGDDVLLAAPTTAQLEALASGAWGRVFHKDSPAVIRRVAH